MGKIWLLLMPIAGLSACGTIDQAPLVYVSTSTFGISSSGGTADTPGAKIVIGYQSVDAAFVPTAYGRHCDPARAVDCRSYPLTPIEGTNTESAETFVDLVKSKAAEYEAAQQEVGKRLDDLDRERKSLAIAEDDKTKYDAAVAAKKALDDAASNAVTPIADGTDATAVASSADDIKRAEQMAGYQAIIDDKKSAASDRDEAKKRVDAAQTTYDSARTNATEQLQALNELADRPSSATGTRTDALSVYGSFDGKSGVTDQTKVSLDLGKTFSTGVAAQQLTDGLAKASRTKSIADCLTAAHAAALTAAGTPDTTALTLGMKACQGGS